MLRLRLLRWINAETNTYIDARRKRRFIFPFDWKPRSEGQDKEKAAGYDTRVLDGTDDNEARIVAIDSTCNTHARRKRRFVFPFDWKPTSEGQDKKKVGKIDASWMATAEYERRSSPLIQAIHMHLQGRGY